MLSVYIFLLGVMSAIILCILISSKQKPNRNITSIDIENKLVQMISDTYQQIGWTDWDSELHRNKDQLKRLERAVKSSEMHILEYDSKTGFAKICGDSNKTYITYKNGCNCADFHRRFLPCKHMYYLAIMLSEKKLQ